QPHEQTLPRRSGGRGKLRSQRRLADKAICEDPARSNPPAPYLRTIFSPVLRAQQRRRNFHPRASKVGNGAQSLECPLTDRPRPCSRSRHSQPPRTERTPPPGQR